MSQSYNAGIVTAYGAAVRGGYSGTYAQFCADLAELGVIVGNLSNISATANTLPEGSLATASYSNGVFTFGIPKGDTGNGISSAVLNNDYTLTINFTDGTHTTTGSIRGAKGDTGNGISSAVLNADYTLTINYTDGTSYTTESIRGERGATGNGIESVEKTSTVDNVDTYTITFTDGNTTTFTVTNANAVMDDTAGLGDTTKAWSANKLIKVDLLEESIPGATATVSFDDDGNPISIVHSINNVAVRTDAFVWTADSVAETRTLSDGTHITITTDLDTLVTTVSDISN